MRKTCVHKFSRHLDTQYQKSDQQSSSSSDLAAKQHKETQHQTQEPPEPPNDQSNAPLPDLLSRHHNLRNRSLENIQLSGFQNHDTGKP